MISRGCVKAFREGRALLCKGEEIAQDKAEPEGLIQRDVTVRAAHRERGDAAFPDRIVHQLTCDAPMPVCRQDVEILEDSAGLL